MFKSVSILLIFVSLSVMAMNDMLFQSDEQINDDYEVKYVNSGQSVLLVCDLPNSMPDGQVNYYTANNK